MARNNKSKPPSEQPVQCFYCKQKLSRIRNLKRHHQSKHQGKLLRTVTDTPLDNYFNVNTSQNIRLTNIHNDNNMETDENQDATNIEVNHDSSNFSDNNNNVHTNQLIPSHTSNIQYTVSTVSIEKLIDSKLNSFKNELTSLIRENQAPSSSCVNKSFVNENSTFIRIRNASTVTELQQIIPVLKSYFSNDESEENNKPCAIICDSCYGKSGSLKLGFFHFDFEGETNRSKMTQSMQFRNLKTRIIEHLKSNSHQNNCAIDKRLHKEEQLIVSRNYSVGMNLARSAYKAIVTHSSQLEFEMEVSCDKAKGVDVGDKDNSRKFAADMTEFFYRSLQQQFMKVMNTDILSTGQPPPFAVIADKLTPSRGTLQVVGIVTIINGELVPLIIDLMPVSHHTGKAIAEYLLQSLQKHFTLNDIKTKCVGGAFDGQYFKLGVPGHFLELLGVNGLDKEWYSFSWDPAHLIERAADSAKKQFVWINKTQNLISSANHEIGVGKGYAFLLEKAKEAEKFPYAPISFCTTRFATYTFNVIQNFLLNYPLMYKKLDTRGLSQCKSAIFILRVTGMCDIYHILNRLSLEVQQPSILPWHVYEYLDRSLDRLNKLVETMKRFCEIPDNNNNSESRQIETNISNEYQNIVFIMELFESGCSESTVIKNFTECANSLSTSKQFKNQDIKINPTIKSLRSNPNKISSYKKAIKSVGLELIKFAEALKVTLIRKFNAQKSAVMITAQEMFSLKKILCRGENELPENFGNYCAKAVNLNVLPSEIDIESLKREYFVFSNLVKNKVKNQMEQGLDVKEVKLYSELIHSTSILGDCRHIAHLLAASCVRTQCEAVSEGMGSIVKVHASKRPNLIKEKLFQEVFLSWNGPPPTNKADKLLEKSLNLKFGTDWNFINKTKRIGSLKTFCVSKVVDRVNLIDGKIPF